MIKEQLWSRVSQADSTCFRTDGDGTPMWRDLLASDPISGFVLLDIAELPALLDFLEVNQDKLCSGYFSYDLGMALQGLTSRHTRQVPLAIIHAYDHWVEYHQGQPNYVGFNQPDSVIEEPDMDSSASIEFISTISEASYESTIARIHEYIRAGDFYQLNFTQQLLGKTSDPISYASILKKHPAAYAMAMDCDELKITSLSPELFLHHADGILTTEPIKGTRPRGATQQEDDAHRQELMSSEKEQAELFMITDLLRNDLGKVSEIGSIALEAVKDMRKLPKVWHTYSRISGRLRQDLKPVDALLSMLPGGSITGCPKKHAMEIIDELEDASRGVYTGSMGYFHPDGDFSFNIAIRTLVQQDSKISLGSGGGITIDSKWAEEWEELLVKASTFK
ncbi:MAG: anthranilate synthase component I family protein [Candidatus Marinimicrobia bacterium]|jgi:para-aminobenzoate synthetase component 1|nr:anthranilate synthase component I family protein [Candidatus Neomarinimicrobiota bacterium]MBT3575511.1 anthranilate synthase component I family protein [Candidatus Neomarinimicrobiota bacterium]MBT3679608.1 anthranilate synthase component I family protein [Candidatus Neomarinimicrobiota bacterium]MBT3950565.1 anthranilate synthase component I family protein [Candidatus Neomarinimicrobiota bacterium]MBT4253448.1 anthranilate synthase component I family protein [Candidatus Neomarinimicrobiota